MQALVVFQKWRCFLSHCPSKGIAVDKQANDDVVHPYRFRKADGLAHQALNARPERQIDTVAQLAGNRFVRLE